MLTFNLCMPVDHVLKVSMFEKDPIPYLTFDSGQPLGWGNNQASVVNSENLLVEIINLSVNVQLSA